MCGGSTRRLCREVTPAKIIMPAKRADFRREGAGIYVNTLAPEEAAERLRAAA